MLTLWTLPLKSLQEDASITVGRGTLITTFAAGLQQGQMPVNVEWRKSGW